MKKILLAMVAIFGYTLTSVAQISFVATLQHDGEFKHYYGSGALVTAYNAAVDGDIITLSPGTFTASSLTINKGITLRGTGTETPDATYAIAKQNLSFISGNINFCSTESSREITVEGIRFTGNVYVRTCNSDNGQGTIKFIKNVFSNVYADYSGSPQDSPKVRFYNDAISYLHFYNSTHPDYLFYNCCITDPRSDSNIGETTTTFVNCVIRWTSTLSQSAYYLNFYNCIFNWTYSKYGGGDSNYLLPNTATCLNCLSINKSTLFNYLVSGANNKTVSSPSDVFKTYTADFGWHETFELTDEAKTKYLGTDGTQIGMQGGNYPYTTTVQYPVITKFNSNAQTSKEGILNIEVEVDGK